jgi:predicted phosphodiesterase
VPEKNEKRDSWLQIKLRKLLTNPVIRLANKYTSHPKRELVLAALDKLYHDIKEGKEKKGLLINAAAEDKFIVFSDHHKGAKNGADDFRDCEQTYLHALDYYEANGFHYICLGDSEELWENGLQEVKKANVLSIEKEKTFIRRGALTKVFGNHDLFWDQDPFAAQYLENLYDEKLKVYAGLVLNMPTARASLSVFLTHGHQGDQQSDGNWFSKFFVSRIWGPFQAYLSINPNTPAYNSQLKTLHNALMYEWSSKRKDLVLVTGHTHQPVFQSLTLLESLLRRLDIAKASGDESSIQSITAEIQKRNVELPVAANLYDKIVPSYFNSGCCCYSDGDITGLEIADGYMRLVKWKTEGANATRSVLEEQQLERLLG